MASVAAPQTMAVAADSDRPIRKSLLRPYSSPSLPAGIRISPKVSEYPATDHDTWAGDM